MPASNDLPTDGSNNAEGTSPIRITQVHPVVGGGAVPIRRIVGDWVDVSAEITTSIGGFLNAAVLFRHEQDEAWQFAEMLADDTGTSWRVSFQVKRPGRHFYTVEAWFESFEDWHLALRKAVAGGQPLLGLLIEGAALIEEARNSAPKDDADALAEYAARLRSGRDEVSRAGIAMERGLREIMGMYGPRAHVASHEFEYVALVERAKARFSAWYHMFVRSCTTDPAVSGTFKGAGERLDDIARMGFDTVLLAPIHPIGVTARKGAGGALVAGPSDPGSPYAVGNKHGGHTEIDASLGTDADFDAFVEKARAKGLEVAIDLAMQCSPDHPWVKTHPTWFLDRAMHARGAHPDDKFTDIVPMNFETEDWRGLWTAWLEVVNYWAHRGIRAFRIDRPHGRPVAFWEWLISETRSEFPDVIFLAESFTRPATVRQLARAGFSQCLTYFTWRNSRDELARHCTEFAPEEDDESFQANLFVNTPDVLSEYLQQEGPVGFMVRATLAATLGSCWGIYSGFELCENNAVAGSEEYLNSEKFAIRPRNWNAKGHIKEYIARLNRIRGENKALHSDARLRLHRTSSSDIFFYSKTSADLTNIVIVVVNLDPKKKDGAWLEVPIESFELGENEVFQVHDLVSDVRFLWQGRYCWVDFDPKTPCPAHVFVIRRRVNREREFDYYH
jgi:starch synthase (maltosyl-transferring)